MACGLACPSCSLALHPPALLGVPSRTSLKVPGDRSNCYTLLALGCRIQVYRSTTCVSCPWPQFYPKKEAILDLLLQKSLPTTVFDERWVGRGWIESVQLLNLGWTVGGERPDELGCGEYSLVRLTPNLSSCPNRNLKLPFTHWCRGSRRSLPGVLQTQQVKQGVWHADPRRAVVCSTVCRTDCPMCNSLLP